MNKLTGVIGVFNCQGAGSWPLKQDSQEKSLSPPTKLPPISGCISPADVEFLEEIVGENWDGDCAVYAFNKGELQIRLLLSTRLNYMCISFNSESLKCSYRRITLQIVKERNS